MALVLAAVAYTVISLRRDRTVLPRPPVELPPQPTGRTMDYDWAVVDMDGNVLEVAEARGRPLFLNIWATWCPPCRWEMPAIDSLYREAKDEGVVFLPVARESAEIVREFGRERGLEVPLYVVKGHWPPELEPRAWPTTYVVSPAGQVVLRHEGAAQWDDENVVELLRVLAHGARTPSPEGQGAPRRVSESASAD
ncbi:MAG: TlpA family protein disulfide reductase [Planctomycetota bacterium]